MKIIMNYCESSFDTVVSFNAVESAIADEIEEGRYNFKSYLINDILVSVCKNKYSYTTYIKHGKGV